MRLAYKLGFIFIICRNAELSLYNTLNTQYIHIYRLGDYNTSITVAS